MQCTHHYLFAGHKVLAASGIRTFDDVRNADADRLQVILSR